MPAERREPRDQVADERPARIKLDRAGELVRDRAEVRARVCEQIDAGCEEQQPAHGSLRGNQRQEPLAARRRRRHCGILTGREQTIPARLLRRAEAPKMPKPADLAVFGLRLHHHSTGTRSLSTLKEAAARNEALFHWTRSQTKVSVAVPTNHDIGTGEYGAVS